MVHVQLYNIRQNLNVPDHIRMHNWFSFIKMAGSSETENQEASSKLFRFLLHFKAVVASVKFVNSSFLAVLNVLILWDMALHMERQLQNAASASYSLVIAKYVQWVDRISVAVTAETMRWVSVSLSVTAESVMGVTVVVWFTAI